MAASFRYTPPTVDARVILAAAVPEAVKAGAEVLLAASNANAPRDTGQMVDTSEVVMDGHKAYISYPATSPEGFPYPIVVHEDMTANHPNGGSAKFLEKAYHSDAEVAAEAEATVLRRAFM